MAKKKAKKSIDFNKIINQVKPWFDIKEWKRKLRYRSENVSRLVNFYTLFVSLFIIGITMNTVVSQGNTSYPLNLTATESIRSEINSATNVKNDLIEHTKKAEEYALIVEEQKKEIEEIEKYLPNVVDPLSLMVHVEQIAEKNNVTINKLILPEDRSVLNEQMASDTGDNEQTESNEQKPESSNQSSDDNANNNESLIGSNLVENEENTNEEEVKEEVKTRKPIVDDMAYVVDITVVGQYSDLSGFFKDLENTKEIIEISDVKISEYQPDEENDNEEEKSYVDVNNFDMEEIVTQVDMKIKLYDESAFVDFMHLDDIVIQEKPKKEESEEEKE